MSAPDPPFSTDLLDDVYEEIEEVCESEWTPGFEYGFYERDWDNLREAFGLDADEFPFTCGWMLWLTLQELVTLAAIESDDPERNDGSGLSLCPNAIAAREQALKEKIDLLGEMAELIGRYDDVFDPKDLDYEATNVLSELEVRLGLDGQESTSLEQCIEGTRNALLEQLKRLPESGGRGWANVTPRHHLAFKLGEFAKVGDNADGSAFIESALTALLRDPSEDDLPFSPGTRNRYIRKGQDKLGKYMTYSPDPLGGVYAPIHALDYARTYEETEGRVGRPPRPVAAQMMGIEGASEESGLILRPPEALWSGANPEVFE